MKKYYLLVILFLCFIKNYGQEPIQEAYVSKTHVMVDEEWAEANYGSMINVSSNRQGQLKIANAEFLTELSGGKAKMLDKSAYTTAELSSPVLIKTKTEKNGLVNMTYEGKFVFKTIEGAYTPNVKVIFVVNQADVIGLKIHNKDNNKDYALDLTIKD
ncbi:hypothetical protein [Flavobacterium gilvum]|uniref:Uncharacterized protein n=1 Tax=Flavobacterium gilvum TaxID=1492737 RepID=A0AAC9I2S2_9FLAO|nr:hypothetical protein [Flavobacterium gilvum]AOW08445.1 hypothetical protein EM308_02415 [Flavobacterium gilvum]KFC57573.1 hypothetical protein FEM08_36510 [Flavobacterium gilvum]